MVVTIEVKINFLALAHWSETLIAEARAVDVKRKISLWQADIRKEQGDVIDIFHGLA